MRGIGRVARRVDGRIRAALEAWRNPIGDGPGWPESAPVSPQPLDFRPFAKRRTLEQLPFQHKARGAGLKTADATDTLMSQTLFKPPRGTWARA